MRTYFHVIFKNINLYKKGCAFKFQPILTQKFSTTSRMKFDTNQPLKVMILDIGTTNTRVRIYDKNFNVILSGKRKTEILTPEKNSSEIDARKLWENVRDLCRSTLENGKIQPGDISFMGITTQRESFLIWDKSSGLPLCNIITWQDRRGIATCRELNQKQDLHVYKYLCEKSGNWTGSLSNKLSASFEFQPNMVSVRLYNFLKYDSKIKQLFKEGNVHFGTVESWIVYNLTEGKLHVTDYASASITSLYDIFDLKYHPKIMYALGFNDKCFPKLINTHGPLFEVSENIFGAKIPVTCLIGDQQSSTFGCGCVEEGAVKATLGTGLFIDLYMGSKIIPKMACECYPLIGWYSTEGKPYYIYETRSDFANDHIYKFILETGIESVQKLDEIINSNDCSGFDFDKNTALKLLNKTIFIFYEVWKQFVENTKENFEISCIKMDGGYSKSDYLVRGIASMCDIKVKRMMDIESTSNGAYYLARLGAGLNKDDMEFYDQFNKIEMIEPDPSIKEKLLEIYRKEWINKL